MSDNRGPLVSMIVICYNQAQFVLETLDSVKAQTYANTELIIVDDCSTDDSVAVIERWLQETGTAATFIRHKKNMGICRTVNDALACASGKYISGIASDDLWLPDKIERQVEIMESQPDHVGVVYSDAFLMDEDGRCGDGLYISSCCNFDEMPRGHVLDVLAHTNFVAGPTSLVRRSCYDNVGRYDEALPYEDWDMWMRIARSYSFACVSEPLAKYRFHAASFCGNRVRSPRGTFEVFAKQLRIGGLSERQRAIMVSTFLSFAAEIYEHNETDAPEKLRLAWALTGRRGPLWMSRFARLRIPFCVWQKALSCYCRIERIRSAVRLKLTADAGKGT